MNMFHRLQVCMWWPATLSLKGDQAPYKDRNGGGVGKMHGFMIHQGALKEVKNNKVGDPKSFFRVALPYVFSCQYVIKLGSISQ